MEFYISAIFKVSDQLKKRPVGAHDVIFCVNGRRKNPLYKPGGYFIFTDLEAGHTIFELSSPIFQGESVGIDVPVRGNGYVMRHIMLNPSAKYPFGGKITVLSGRLLRDGIPLSKEQFHIVPADGGETMKIAQDNVEPGSRRLKLFAVVPERKIIIPGKYMIKDKAETKREFCLITTGADKDGIYSLENGIMFAHQRATPLVSVIECTTAEDGTFFIAITDVRGGKSSLDVLIKGKSEKSIKKTFEIEENVKNNLGDIEA
jgi:hypothetical protein